MSTREEHIIADLDAQMLSKIEWHTPTVVNLEPVPLYTQREWVGLTDDERMALFETAGGLNDYAKAIEAKLKQKNAGGGGEEEFDNWCKESDDGADDGGVKCKTHPDAPHSFLRNASHNEGRYVCECEHWKENT